MLEGDPAFPLGEAPSPDLQDFRFVPPGGSCTEGVDPATGEWTVVIRRADGTVWAELRPYSATVRFRDVATSVMASAAGPEPQPALLRTAGRTITVPGRPGDAGARQGCPRHAPRVRVAAGQRLTLLPPGPVAYAVLREARPSGIPRRVLAAGPRLSWTTEGIAGGPRTAVVRVWDAPGTFTSYVVCLVPRIPSRGAPAPGG